MDHVWAPNKITSLINIDDQPKSNGINSMYLEEMQKIKAPQA